jgi:Cu2+-exporting ATPase
MFQADAPVLPPADAPAAAQALLLDDPQEWSAFGRPLTPTGSIPQDPATCGWDSQVVLEGMHCAACALTIEDALRAVPGVQQADVSAATRRARVVWHPGQVLPSQWMAAVHRAGYRAMPAMDARAAARCGAGWWPAFA